MNRNVLFSLAVVCLFYSKELVAAGGSTTNEVKLRELSEKARSMAGKKGYSETLKAIQDDPGLQKEVDRDLRIPLLQAACLFELGERETAIKLIEQKVLPLGVRSGSGYIEVALRLAQSDLLSKALPKELNVVLDGHAEVDLIAVSDEGPIEGSIVATDVKDGQKFTIHSPQEKASSPNTRYVPTLLPPGAYRLSVLYNGERLDGGHIDVSAWQSISKKVNFQFPKEILILNPKNNEKMKAGTKVSFRWQWALENKEHFVVELSRIVNEHERYRIWGPYESKVTNVVFNVDNTASETTLLPGIFEFCVFVSSGEKFSTPKGKAIVFEVIPGGD